MNVLIRVDSSPVMGGGHAMRCLTLADELKSRGAVVTFACASTIARIGERIEASGHRLAPIERQPELGIEDLNWDSAILSAQAQIADALATLGSVSDQPDWIVVDHYRVDRTWHEAARARARLLVIDDLANRRHACDMLLDQTLSRTEPEYRQLVDEECRLLLGPVYALLRPEFAAARPAALRRRRNCETVERLLISMGTADAGSFTLPILEAVERALPEAAIDVVLTNDAPSFAGAKQREMQNKRVTVHTAPRSLAELMRDADLAVGAAGTTSWERSCLGLPTVTLAVADNQRGVLVNLSAAGLAVAADGLEQAIACLGELARDTNARSRLAAAGFAAVDGRGASRVAELMMGQTSPHRQVTIRPARPSDCEAIWLWRNDPITRTSSRTTTPIEWPNHCRWFEFALRSEDKMLLIADVDGEPAAVVRFDKSDRTSAEVSINLDPGIRGKKLGPRILAETCKQYFSHSNDIDMLVAGIHHTNLASASAFRKVGFAPTGHLDAAGFETYEKRDPSKSGPVGKA